MTSRISPRDFSLAIALLAICAFFAVLVTQAHWPAPVAMLTALAVALVLWWAMGNLIVRQRIPAFIITLGGLLVFKGCFWFVIQNHTVPIVPGGHQNLYS